MNRIAVSRLLGIFTGLFGGQKLTHDFKHGAGASPKYLPASAAFDIFIFRPHCKVEFLHHILSPGQGGNGNAEIFPSFVASWCCLLGLYSLQLPDFQLFERVLWVNSKEVYSGW
jgi:hypothetical protein